MDDYSFMRSGLGAQESVGVSEDFAIRLISLVMTMIQHATKTAVLYAEHAGRSEVTPQDIHRSLRYEAQAFFHRESLEQDVQETEMLIRDYSTDEEESSEEEEPEPQTQPFTKSTCTCTLCSDVNRIWDTWDAWNPEDEAEKFVKNAVDKTIQECGF